MLYLNLCKMVKYKFPGKPSKISQRSLVSAYSITVPSYDTSSVSEAVCYGLSIFDNIFEYEDKVSSFHGFSLPEIHNSFEKREKYSAEIQDKFSQRGISYQPSFHFGTGSPITITNEKSSFSKFSNRSAMRSENEFVSLPNRGELRKRGKIWIRNKKIINRYHTKIQARHTFKGLNKNSLMRFKHKPSSNYLSEKYCRKFVLPSRSLHSSRVIKPNKRFMDTDKNTKTRTTFSNDNPNSTDTNVISDCEKKPTNVIPSNKVIIREARLNITTEAAITGPFSVKKNVPFDKDKFRSGVIACGVCGLVRYYKHVLQTKKFGIYSCEQCRRFILKMIKQSKQPHYEIIRCRNENGVGKCAISSAAIKQKETSDNYSPSKNIHCPACWLILCLQRYMIPNTIRKLLVRLIPEGLKVFPSNVVSIDLKKSLHYETDHTVSAVTHKTDDVNDTLKKRLRVNYYFKSISSNKRALEKNEISATVKSRYFPFKRNAGNQKVNAKNKSTQESVHKENNDKDLHTARGPRIKHVCRSASSVLKSSLVALNGDETEDPLYNSSESDLTLMNKENVKTEKQNQLNKVRHCDDSLDVNPAGKEFAIAKQYGARSLQDFCKESSDESDENEDKLISIDFWEAYDPDEIFKTGFPLISSEPVNVRALCFLCGSTGLEKLLYCVCCCEPYHWYCAEGPSAFREEAELEKCRVSWVCRKCKVCSTCGEGGSRLLISCQLCRDSYHTECLSSKALNKRVFKSDRPWVCPTCLKCKSCNGSSVFLYVGNVPLCSPCFKLRQKGNYCPLCQGCYQDEDYNVQMMECGICKCWIHAKCEGISYEKYQILSFLPETIEFVCRLCCKVPPAQWCIAVEDELKARCLGILKCLCKNKQIGDLFKESPKKDSACTCLKRQVNYRPDDTLIGITHDNEYEKFINISPINRLNMNDERSQNNIPITKIVKGKYEFEEYYNPELCNVCNNNAQTKTKTNQRLLAIKANVHNNQYSSLSIFHQELENVIKEVEEQNLVHSYREIVKKFFPWFEPENVLNNLIQEHVMETQNSDCMGPFDLTESSHSSEDDYAGLQKLLAQDEYRYENFRLLDVRRCNLCKGLGEAIPSEGGRLIYCGRNEWVHSNCALWSSEVFEEIDGSLQNVHSAISRGRQIRCSACEKKGASVGCCFKNCGVTYHFLCAKKARCKFFQNKTIYCKIHEGSEITLPLLTNEKDFEILRPVYVELDRKKKKFECHANVKLHIGSLHVESLGKIDPHLSDDPKHIIPVYFRCTRLYWSTSKPWKIVQYQIQIKVRYSFQQCATGETDVNYTVDHSKQQVADEQSVTCQVVNDLVKKVCSISDEENSTSGNGAESNNSNSNNDLLFPELQDAIYKDLPNDVLNDKTLHDIWNNYDNGDDNNDDATSISTPQCIFDDEKLRSLVTQNDLHVIKQTDRVENEMHSNVRKPHMLSYDVIIREKDVLNETKAATKMYKKLNSKYLRDKNDFEANFCQKKNHRVTAVAAVMANAFDDIFYDELGSRITTKRKINVEKSTSITRKKLCENDFKTNLTSTAIKLGNASIEYYQPYENMLQLDGMVDIYSDEEPVKCVQCRRTYRTTLSFERHLETCNADFSDCTISSGESDSASGEEEKYTSCDKSIIKAAVYDPMMVSPLPTKHSTSYLTGNTFSAKYANIVQNNKKLNTSAAILPQPYATDLGASIDLNSMYQYAATTYEDVHFVKNGDMQNAMNFQSMLNNTKQESAAISSSPVAASATDTIEPTTLELNFVNAKMPSVTLSCSSYTVDTPNQYKLSNMPETQTFEIQNMVATPVAAPAAVPVVTAAAPTYILQSFPKTEIVPAYVTIDSTTINDCMRASETTYLSQPLQLQQVATVNQPTQALSFQPIVPTILGTIVQPNVIETPTYIVNTSGNATATAAATMPSAELFAMPQGNIILPNQPMFTFGMETAVVSNTVMSSSQFMTQSPIGNLGGTSAAMYSTTTTQVFQAAKQLPQTDFSSGFIVLNPTPPAASHTTLQPLQQTTLQAANHVQHISPPLLQQSPSVNGSKYVYVQINEIPKVKKQKPIIIKSAKQNVTVKKAMKVMKVKNNRPVSIQTVNNTVPIPTHDRPTYADVSLISHISTKHTPTRIDKTNVKHLKIKTTDKTLVCKRDDKNCDSREITRLNGYTNVSQLPDKIFVIENQCCKSNVNEDVERDGHDNGKISKQSEPEKSTTNSNIQRVNTITVTTAKNVTSTCQQQLQQPAQFIKKNAEVKTSLVSSNPVSGILLSANANQKDLITTRTIEHSKNDAVIPGTNSLSGKCKLNGIINNQFSSNQMRSENGTNLSNSADDKSHFTSQSYLAVASVNDCIPGNHILNTMSANQPSALGDNTDIEMKCKPAKSIEHVNNVRDRTSSTQFNDKAKYKENRSMPSINSTFYEDTSLASMTSAHISETDKIFDELLKQHKEQSRSQYAKTNSKSKLEQEPSILSKKLPLSPFLHKIENNVQLSCAINSSILVKQDAETQSSTSTSVTNTNSVEFLSKSTTDIIAPTTSNIEISHNEDTVKTSLSLTLTNKTKYIPHINQKHKYSFENKSSLNCNKNSNANANAIKKKKCPQKENNFEKIKNRSPEIAASASTSTTESATTAAAMTARDCTNWKTASISYEVNAEDGFSYKTNNLLDLWNKILESVQQSRIKYKLPLLPKNASVNAESVYKLLGFENNASKYLLEQLPDAWKCIFYKPVFHKSTIQNGKMSPVENESGCARTEPFTSSHKFDMFGWLASRHRKPPKFMMISDSDIVNGNRRITSLNLPMAMRFRHLKETAKETVGVFRSDIHGRGLFCLRDIDSGEMVIEYAGEVIRSTLTDKREKCYTSKGIGCYMFRIDDKYVVDATMCGNAARFINHSCEPNCYSRIVDILGKKHILIFALRRIPKGEELTYDYKFPLEDEKIYCHCLSRKCRKYLN